MTTTAPQTPKKKRLTTSAMIASFADPGQKTAPAPFGHALATLAEGFNAETYTAASTNTEGQNRRARPPLHRKPPPRRRRRRSVSPPRR